MAFGAEEKMSTTSVLAGSVWHIEPLGHRNAEAILEKGVRLVAHPDVYL